MLVRNSLRRLVVWLVGLWRARDALRTGSIVLMLLTISVSLPLAYAQSPDKAQREREALRRVQQALRSAQAENAALTSEKNRLETARTALSEQNAALLERLQQGDVVLMNSRTRQKAADTRLAAQDQEISRLSADLAMVRKANEELSQRLDKTVLDARQVVATLRQRTSSLTQEVAELRARNLRMFELGTGLVKAYRARATHAVLLDQMSALGFGQVSVDNAAEAWLDQFEQARWDPLQAKTPPLVIDVAHCHLLASPAGVSDRPTAQENVVQPTISLPQ